MGSRQEGLSPSLTLIVGACLLAGLLWDEAEAAGSPVWSYENKDGSGTDIWGKAFYDCNGTMQSPVNIDTKLVVYDPNLEYFDLSDYGSVPQSHMKLENVGGHTAEVVLTGKPIYIKKGSLPARYILEQFHFHWGYNDSRGSEHSINGQFTPMEVHFVHRQERFPNMSVAASHPFGLAVIGFFFRVGNENPKYNALLESLAKIPNANDEAEIEPLPLLDLIQPPNFDFYRYQGSLTTPPCYESVIWSLAINPIEISPEQLSLFRTLRNEKCNPLVDDYRATQALNSRTIQSTIRK